MSRLSLSRAERALRSFSSGSYSRSQNGITREPTLREDGHIFGGDDVHRAPWAPHLDEPGILPGGGRYILYARVERQDGGSRRAVLKSCERGLAEPA
jgi:hypothetical protein